MEASGWNWYGVKLIKKLNIKGKPKKELIDEYYKDTVQNFEETIVVVKAQSFDQAYKIAEEKALKDNEPYHNIYGQEVSWDLVKAIDCFLIYDEIESGTEVYSCFYQTSKAVSDNSFIQNNIVKDIEDGCRMGRSL